MASRLGGHRAKGEEDESSLSISGSGDLLITSWVRPACHRPLVIDPRRSSGGTVADGSTGVDPGLDAAVEVRYVAIAELAAGGLELSEHCPKLPPAD